MGDVGAPDLEELRAFTARLRCVGPCGDAGLGIEWLDAVESLKSVGCAVQAVAADDVATCMREDRKARRLPRAEWDRGRSGTAVSPRRLRWRAGSPRTAAGGIWGSLGRWCTRCRTRWRCCGRAG